MTLNERRGKLQSTYQDWHQSLSATLRQELDAAQEKVAAAKKELEQQQTDELSDRVLALQEEADKVELKLKDHEDGFFEGYRDFLDKRER